MDTILSEYKDVFPVATFILGYFFNEIIGLVKARRSLKQLRFVLDYEVNRNIELLASSRLNLPEENDEQISDFNSAKLNARIADSLSTSVFDAHISELSKMKEHEVGTYLSLYSTINSLKSHSKDLIEYLHIESRSEVPTRRMWGCVQAVNTLAEVLVKRKKS